MYGGKQGMVGSKGEDEGRKMRVLLGGPGWQAEEVSYPRGGEESFV